MEIMIISILAMVLIFFAFITGLHYGTKIKNNEPIDVNPVNKIKRHVAETKEKENKAKEQEIIETNLKNIESYDGTGLGQVDIPR